MIRFYKFLLYLGYPAHSAREVKVNQFCKVLTEFSLEYRAARDKVMQQRLKKAQQRERNKTRGKLIINVSLTFCLIFALTFLNHSVVTEVVEGWGVACTELSIEVKR